MKNITLPTDNFDFKTTENFFKKLAALLQLTIPINMGLCLAIDINDALSSSAKYCYYYNMPTEKYLGFKSPIPSIQSNNYNIYTLKFQLYIEAPTSSVLSNC